MVGPSCLRLLAAAAIGLVLLFLLVEGLDVLARAAVREAEIGVGQHKFVVVR